MKEKEKGEMSWLAGPLLFSTGSFAKPHFCLHKQCCFSSLYNILVDTLSLEIMRYMKNNKYCQLFCNPNLWSDSFFSISRRRFSFSRKMRIINVCWPGARPSSRTETSDASSSLLFVRDALITTWKPWNRRILRSIYFK
jgi:hypothetical protein